MGHRSRQPPVKPGGPSCPHPPVRTVPPDLVPGDFYTVVFETLGGATVGFVGKHIRTTDFGHVFEDGRTNRDVVAPLARILSCVSVDGPWLSPREVRELAGS